MHVGRTNRMLLMVVLGLTPVAAACGRHAPTAPAPAAPVSSGRTGTATTALTFPLNGTFTLTMENGTVSGTYTGVADGRVDSQTILRLAVTGGTGAFAGADGTLKGDGSGAFTGEGNFSLSLKGPVAAATSRLNLRVTFTGVSALSCVAEQVQITQQGTGVLDGTAVTGLFTHVVGNAGCIG